ncbi:MAG: hypothetical protein MUC88_15145 [Planctomycetes bacterium]|nr:hypothetical protein [Planctomycetota bacterium]
MLFTENQTNVRRLLGAPNPTPYTKDAFHEYVIRNDAAAVNAALQGTKAAPYYRLTVGGHRQVQVRLRLCAEAEAVGRLFGPEFEGVFTQRSEEADSFYKQIIPQALG